MQRYTVTNVAWEKVKKMSTVSKELLEDIKALKELNKKIMKTLKKHKCIFGMQDHELFFYDQETFDKAFA